MPNNRFNKQVTPKGYQKGGSVKEEPMRDRKKQPLKRKNFKDADPDRKFLKQKQGVKFFEAKAGGMTRKMGKKKPVLSEEGKRKIKSRMTGGDSTGILFPDVYKVKKMGGGMIKRPMMKKGGVASEAKKKQFKSNQTKQKETTKKVLKAMVGPFNPVSAGQNVAKKIKERMGRKMGGALKPVDPKTQKGLSKLPTEVRNKMGYMKKGGKVHGK